MENKQYKSLSGKIFGTLREIKHHSTCKAVKLEGNNGMIWWAFLNSDKDYSHLIDKKVTCVCSFSKKAIEDEIDVVGWETVVNIFDIIEYKANIKNKS